jgi:hypothetical protein
MADAERDALYDLMVIEWDATTTKFHEATRSFLVSAIECERRGIALIAHLLGLRPPAADWFKGIVMERTSLSEVARILTSLIKESDNAAIPSSLPTQLRAIARLRNRFAHEHPDFDGEFETLSLTDARGQVKEFSFKDIERSAHEARMAVEEMGKLLEES